MDWYWYGLFPLVRGFNDPQDGPFMGYSYVYLGMGMDMQGINIHLVMEITFLNVAQYEKIFT